MAGCSNELQAVFDKYAQIGKPPREISTTLGLSQWLKLLKDLGLIPKAVGAPTRAGITRTDAEMALVRCAGRGQKRLEFVQFCQAVEIVAGWLYDAAPKEEALSMLVSQLVELAPLVEPTPAAGCTGLSSCAERALRAVYEHFALMCRPLDRVMDRAALVLFVQCYSLQSQLSEAATVRIFLAHADGHGGESLSFGAFVQCLHKMGQEVYGAEGLKEMLEHIAGADCSLQLQRKMRGTPEARALQALRSVGEAPGQPKHCVTETLSAEELAAVRLTQRRLTDRRGLLSLGALMQLARECSLMDPPGRPLTATDLDSAYHTEAARAIKPAGSPGRPAEFAVVQSGSSAQRRGVRTEEQFVRVLMHLGCLKYPDARDEETALQLIIQAHIMPQPERLAPECELSNFFTPEVLQLLDSAEEELEAVLLQYGEPGSSVHPGLSLQQWLRFCREYDLVRLSSLRILKRIFDQQRGDSPKLTQEGFVNALCCVAVRLGQRKPVPQSPLEQIQALLVLVEASPAFQSICLQSKHVATKTRICPPPPLSTIPNATSQTKLHPKWSNGF